MEAEVTTKKREGKDTGKPPKSPQIEAGSGKKGQKSPQKNEKKGLGKCQLFVELLKNSPEGLDWQTVENQKWNDNKAHYPGTFKKLVDENLAYRKDKRMFWGKAPVTKKSNGKDSKKGDKLAAGSV